jgi:N-sulfoglucosamine sulfohydrolase
LIDDPVHASQRDELRGQLEARMIKTGDPMLEVYRRRGDAAFREAYMKTVEREADGRRAGEGGKKGGKKGKRKAKADDE